MKPDDAADLQNGSFSHEGNEKNQERVFRRRKSSVYDWQIPSPSQHVQSLREARDGRGDYGVNLQPLFLGIAACKNDEGELEIGFASHDGVYTVDFATRNLGKDSEHHSDNQTSRRPSSSSEPKVLAADLADYLITHISDYMHKHYYKFVGIGITKSLHEMSPQLPARFWTELDSVPLVFDKDTDLPEGYAEARTVDELADSMARKTLMYFGPTMQPRLLVGFRGEVAVDVAGIAQMVDIESYRKSVGSQKTWDACMEYVNRLKGKKIAFFNSTPQGGGVALMRHALIRFFRLVGVDCKWYVPKPKPEVFRITKTNHNILQGVADPKERLTTDQQQTLDEWCEQNARRFWMSSGGPLAACSDGGADVVIVDDPQMPGLVKLARENEPQRPVVFRSHIQIRADLVDQGNNPTAEVWKWVWDKVKSCDVFVAHPVREFVPQDVPANKAGYMPATTDFLDGLNKDMQKWDLRNYVHMFNAECFKMRMTKLAFPRRDYIVQIARFDPSKGIPHVLASYAELRRTHMKDTPAESTPQLVIAGHGAVDDPDASSIYDQTIQSLETDYADIQPDVIVLRLGPTDQILNALLSNAKVALQLSSREGFEVKASEALHKGIPVIATEAGGLPLQVEHGKAGFLVETGDASAVAGHLYDLFTDARKYETMSQYAARHVSDEVGTVGNALCWLYLADALVSGRGCEPESRWIVDMAREEVGMPYGEDEVKLPRKKGLDLRGD